MKRIVLYTWALSLLFSAYAENAQTSPGSYAVAGDNIIKASGVKGGLVVCVGVEDPEFITGLHVNDSYLVHALIRSSEERGESREKIDRARAYIQGKGLYGKVSVDTFDGNNLPYADNLVNLIVIRDPGSGIRDIGKEIERVLAPRGVALIKEPLTINHQPSTILHQSPAGLKGWNIYKKKVPPEIDDWTHYLHGPDNNAVAQDQIVGPPRRLQWAGSPAWARHHDHMGSTVAMVSAAGRLFYIIDEGSVSSIQLPAEWFLVARDAFNGKILWKRKIASWWPHIWPNKAGFALLPRRLVADADRVYVTLGLNEPLTALDAETGAVIRTYPDIQVTEEVILSENILFLVVTDHVEIPKYPEPDIMRVNVKAMSRKKKLRTIQAVQADTGVKLWAAQHHILPMTLAADSGRIYFHDGESIVALDRKTGKSLWVSKPIPVSPAIAPWFAPTLVVVDDIVMFAGGEKVSMKKGGKDTMTAVDAGTGDILWTEPHPPCGYASPEDLFVIDGLVWSAPLSNKRDSGLFLGRDLKTGEIKREYPDTTGGHMPHHRCHRAKATEKYILTSRSGIEFVNVRGKEERSRHDWTRGECLYGLMPANGLIYTPPHACACYVLAKLNGLNALAPKSEAGRVKREAKERLIKGPAYSGVQNLSSVVRPLSSASGKIPRSASRVPRSDWPTYRHDPARSGYTPNHVPADLKSAWKTKLGGRLSALVVAGKQCYVASIDTHTVYALDADSGKEIWNYIAGGPVDSPPSVHAGHVVFGCRDGWIYCLRAADGKLIWRFRAAPRDERIMAFEQIESSWPVHGSVLIRENEVHCVAGRSMFLAGGIRYLRLNIKTGELISETIFDDHDPITGKKLDEDIRWPNLPTTLPDILSCDEKNIYMRTLVFNMKGEKKQLRKTEAPDAHLFSPIGFLDGSWWHRSYWIYGGEVGAGAGGWVRAGQKAPAGRMLVFDEETVCGFRRNTRHFAAMHVSSWMEYHLFAMKKVPELGEAFVEEGPPKMRKRTVPCPKNLWSSAIPILVKAMVLTPDKVFISGPPDILDEEQINCNLNDQNLQAKAAEQADALQGNRGGILWAVSSDDGAKLAEYKLDAPPVWDGMAAAADKLYISLKDGSVVCWKED
ncbi:PQQ-binding-like beta-propeller repeat protein [Verrucomicrobiota bacterium]